MGDIAVFICMGFLFFVIFFVKGKMKQKEMELQEKKKKVSSPSSHSHSNVSSMHHKPHTHFSRTYAPSYEVEEKKKYSFLQKRWTGKASLKQAFILSEILKRKDDL
ncbi:MAG: hypothetical protein V4489_00385 [Chlamydiota bacterium]